WGCSWRRTCVRGAIEGWPSYSPVNVGRGAPADDWPAANGAPQIRAGEDLNRARAGSSPENLGWLRRVALARLKQEEGKDSIKCKPLQAGWDTDFLGKLLGRLDHHLPPQ